MASLPYGQQASAPVVRKRAATIVAFDDDPHTEAANLLARNRHHMFEKWRAGTDILAFAHKAGDGLGRPDQHKVADLWRIGFADPVEADRHTGRRVPYQFHRHSNQRGGSDSKRRKPCQACISEPGHRSISRRFSQAACRIFV